jgi:hypothetical protein
MRPITLVPAPMRNPETFMREPLASRRRERLADPYRGRATGYHSTSRKPGGDLRATIAPHATRDSPKPTLTLFNAEVREGPGFTFPTFRAVLDAPSSVPVSFKWFTQDVTTGTDDYDRAGGTVTFAAGQTEASFQVRNRDEGQVEAGETFEVIAYDPRGLDFPQDAALMIATGTILDDDGAPAAEPRGDAGTARLVFGPEAEPGPLPTMAAFDTGFFEGVGGPLGVSTVVVLDQPATTTGTIDFYVDPRSAIFPEDHDGGGGTVTFEAGQRSALATVTTRGNGAADPDRGFALVFNDPRNLVIAEGAQAYEVVFDVIDGDRAEPGQRTGLGGFGDPIFGPDRVDDLPTLRVDGVDVPETFDCVELLWTLDGPSVGDVSFDFTFQDRTANGQGADSDNGGGTVSVVPGQQSGTITVVTRDDVVIEGDEEIEVLLYGIRGARFEGGAAALETVVGYLDDDGGPLSRDAGRTGPAAQIDGPASLSPVLPTIQAFDAVAIEGDGGPDGMAFLVTLDRPAPADVTFEFVALPATASLFEEFDRAGGTATIAAGEQSAVIGVTLRGDGRPEDDEVFDLLIYNPTNGILAGGGVAQVARGTILDDDSITLGGVAGRGAPAGAVQGPAFDEDVVRLGAVPASVREFDDGTPDYLLRILLSEPAREEVTFQWRSVADGTASEDDFLVTGSRDPVRIAEGDTVGFIGFEVFGDTRIEGDETS